jgi:hypothetical protein
VSQAIPLGAVYTGINGGSAPINQSRPLAGTLVGDYSPNLIHVVSFYLSWRF